MQRNYLDGLVENGAMHQPAPNDRPGAIGRLMQVVKRNRARFLRGVAESPIQISTFPH